MGSTSCPGGGRACLELMTDQGTTAHDIKHASAGSRRHVGARCPPPGRRRDLRRLGAQGDPGGAGPGGPGPGSGQPRHAPRGGRRMDRPRPRGRRRAALRLPDARRLEPRRRYPVQPRQAAARPLRASDHRRGRLLRSDPGPHPGVQLRPGQSGLDRRGSAERRGRQQPAAQADRSPDPDGRDRALRAACQGLHPVAPGGAGAPARDVRGAGLPGDRRSIWSPSESRRSSCCPFISMCPSRS